MKERTIGADGRVPWLCIRVYNTTSFEFDTAVWPFLHAVLDAPSSFVFAFRVLTITRFSVRACLVQTLVPQPSIYPGDLEVISTL